MEIKFTKMHGLGNDFVIMDNISLTTSQIQLICNRHFGVGCDQLVMLLPNNEIKIYNIDGSEAENCGNALRCVTKLLYEQTGKKEFSIKIKNRRFQGYVIQDDLFSINMGPADFKSQSIPTNSTVNCLNFNYKIDDYIIRSLVSFGNPHALIIVDDLENIPLAAIGSRIEKLPIFQNGINVSFAQILAEDKINLRVWERGSGATFACGSAACATFAILHKLGFAAEAANINLPGGTLELSIDKDRNIIMTGPAVKVFKGSFFPN